MATAATKRRGYQIYGNVAYDPAYAPEREREGRAEPLIRPRERVVGRERVRVRQAGYVAPTAVIGFIAVAALAILILMSYVQLTDTANQIVHLRREAESLATEHTDLMTQYELAFDLKTVEEQMTASGKMVQPGSAQVVSLNLSEPDSAKLYSQPKENILGELWESLTGAVENIGAFFR